MPLRVVFADDNYLVREGVSALLDEADEIDLLETVADPASLLKAVAEHRPDAVLTDIRMPPTHTTEGIDAAKQIRAEHPETGVVVLSQYVEEDYAFDLLSDGVSGLGYLFKERVRRSTSSCGAPRCRARRLRAGPESRRGPDGAKVAGGRIAAARAHRPRTRGLKRWRPAATTRRPRRRCS